MMTKLRQKPNHEDQTSSNRCQNSPMVCDEPIGGTFISRISNVIAIANTPSQKASSLACSLFSAMLVLVIERYIYFRLGAALIILSKFSCRKIKLQIPLFLQSSCS